VTIVKKTSITLPQPLFDQVQRVAKQLQISHNQVFEMAVVQFMARYQPPAETRNVINQGDVYWLSGAQDEIGHPYVVIQENVLNHSRIQTVVVCALTSNLKRASLPGNVLLDEHEANLPKLSVVEVSKVNTVDKAQLGEYIGTLSDQRIEQIRAGMRFLQVSFGA